MRLLDILHLDCIKAPLAATDKQAAINELIDLLIDAGRVTSGPTLKEAVWTREQTRTTGIGHGLAIPHGKATGVETITLAIGQPAKPMEFQAIDNKPVQLIILLASPPSATSDHIQALAHISRLMTMEEFRHRVYAAKSPGDIYELFKQHDQPA
jgi:fructose-specific phosphotransferase system IIA component